MIQKGFPLKNTKNHSQQNMRTNQKSQNTQLYLKTKLGKKLVWIYFFDNKQARLEMLKILLGVQRKVLTLLIVFWRKPTNTVV